MLQHSDAEIAIVNHDDLYTIFRTDVRILQFVWKCMRHLVILIIAKLASESH